MSDGTTELVRQEPLYMQVVKQLRAQIASGELQEGDRIPSQRAIMDRWRVSMQTASKVIGSLKTEALAIPSVGRDTIVAPGAAARIAAAAEGSAYAPAEPPPAPDSVVTAQAQRAAAPAKAAEVLGIPSGRRSLRRRETISTSDDQAATVTTLWFPPDIAEKAPRLADSQPLPAGALAYIAEATGARASRATEETAAEAAAPDTATALGVRPGSPVMVTRTRYSTNAGQTIAYTEAFTAEGGWRTRTYTITGN